MNALFKGHNRTEYALFSIADSLPGLSVSAELAARQIVNACRYGDPELVISWPAKLAALFHGLFPGATADALGAVDRLLPGPGGVGSRSVKGRDSTSASHHLGRPSSATRRPWQTMKPLKMAATPRRSEAIRPGARNQRNRRSRLPPARSPRGDVITGTVTAV